MTTFQDFFSNQSSAYAQFRPRYPDVLYHHIVSHCPDTDLAWDSGTGNGQAAVDLAEYFDQVYATDPSAEQISRSMPHPRVVYAVGTAENPDLENKSVSLVTAAQAAHWYKFDDFHKAVDRILKPSGIICFWAYDFHKTHDPRINEILEHVGKGILGPYWQPQPKMIWNGYADIPFPYEALAAPEISLDVRWNLHELAGYISSWSSAQKYFEENRHHCLEPVADDLVAAWGDPDTKKELQCGLVIKLGRKSA